MALGGKDTTWKHATHGSPSSNTDYTAKTRSVSITLDGEEVDATVFGDAYREFEQSFKSAEISATYKYDSTIWTVLADLYANGTSVTFELSPVGTGSGAPKITGSMILRTYNPNYEVGSLQELPATWRVTGAITFGSH